MHLMKQNTLLIIFSLLSTLSYSQVKGELESTRLINLDIIGVSSKKPPKTEVIFRAQDFLSDQPIWDLKLEDIIVYEDSVECEPISLDQISKNNSINICLIIDHSGSMSIGLPTLTDMYNIVFNDAKYVSPLENAKKSAKVFSSSFNYKKDNISIISFGSKVDLNTILTNDSVLITNAINDIKISGSTAYFDALIKGIDQLKNKNGVNVIVSLTDGAENSSTHNLNDVISKSNRYNIPIYSIGLGLVQKDTLKIIADTTNGQFYHTNSPSELKEIYLKIGKQIQSFYVIEYKSNTLKRLKNRNISVDFKYNSTCLKNVTDNPDVIAYLKKINFNKKVKKIGKISIYVIIGVSVITLVYIRRRRKNRL